MSTQAVNRYKVDLREYRFLLFEHMRLGELLGKAPYEGWGRDEVEMVLDGVDRYAREVSGPLNAVGDREGCRLEDGKVVTPPGFKDAWDKLWETGFKTVSFPEEHGGQGAPYALGVMVEEFLCGSNVSLATYFGLTAGAAELIAAFGTDEQKHRYLEKMLDGRWSGTMCLTEPQAGSDVGATKSVAKRRPDGTYQFSGTKMFISAGDHDLAENVVHMALARIEGAPAGTKGLSLFIVPKRRVGADGASGEGNDVVVGGLEHKMGIAGSCTCLLNFGENDGCVGELLGGEENVGMSQMFKMMNGMRIGVAIQSLGVASTAYLNALEYSRERKQGSHITRWKDADAPRVPIIEHPDVRRMLLDMKARVEGIRALIFKLAVHQDWVAALAGKDDAKAQYHQGQVDLLVPLVKAYGSDQAFRICETAIQTYGGVGYTRDYPVEQYLRDAKVFSIYEGTNHIQAMDLVGRKLGQKGGNNFRALLGDIGQFVAAHGKHPVLGAEVQALGKTSESLGGAAMQYLQWSTGGKMTMIPLYANRFLEMMSETCVAWLLLDQAIIAEEAAAKLPEDHPDRTFYAGKRAAAQYFARNVLPEVTCKAKVMKAEDPSAIDIPDGAFATV